MIVMKKSIDRDDYPRWIDTSGMLSDCLTKTVTSCRLIETLSTGIFDMRPIEESLAIKAKKGSGNIEERAGTIHEICKRWNRTPMGQLQWILELLHGN